MYQIAVCDDDKNITAKLKTAILEICPENQVQVYHDGTKLLDSATAFDIIFLDIDMPGMNGIETAKRIRTKDKSVKIIYLTSYAEYVHYAFSVHAFAYLLKPFKKEMIEKQLMDAKEYRQEPVESKIIRFETEEGMQDFAVNEIYYLEYVGRKVKMVTKQGDFLIREGIHALAEQVEPYGFLMPHKSFSVNLYHVKIIKGYDIVMMNGDVVPLSQKKSSEFRSKLSGFQAAQI